MLRTLTTSFALAFATSLVLGVALPEPAAHAAPKKPPPSKKKPAPQGPDGVGPVDKDKYPLAERIRPLVLPDQMGEVGLDLDYQRFGGADLVSTDLSFAYGIGDMVELGVATGLLLAPDVAYSRAVVLQGHFLLVDTKDFDFAPGIVLPISFYENAPFGAVIDLNSRYVVSKTVFFTFGQGAIPIGFSPGFSFAVSGNGGIGIQASKQFLLFADTSFFTLILAPDAAATGIWETLALSFGGQYSPTRYWDIGAKVNVANTWEVSDSLAAGFTLYGRVRF